MLILAYLGDMHQTVKIEVMWSIKNYASKYSYSNTCYINFTKINAIPNL